MKNVMTRRIAEDIAKDAAALEFVNYPPDYSGFWTIWEDKDNDVDMAIAINKMEDDDGRKYYSIYISPSDTFGESDYDYTKGMTEEELVEKILEVAAKIEKKMEDNDSWKD